MRFALSPEQRSFAAVLDRLLAGADVAGTTRAWGVGDTAPGFELWARLAEVGVTALGMPEDAGGIGAEALDLAVAAETLGYHGVPARGSSRSRWRPHCWRAPSTRTC